MQTLEHYLFNGIFFACIVGLVIQTGKVYQLEEEIKVLKTPIGTQKLLKLDKQTRAIMCAK